MEAEPEYREGYKITNRSIALKTDVISCKTVYGKTNTRAQPSLLSGGQQPSSGNLHSASSTPHNAANHSGSAQVHRVRSFSGSDNCDEDENSVLISDVNESSARMEASAPTSHASPTRTSEERIHIDSWVLLVPRMQDANDLLDIKSKIDILAIPTMGCLSIVELNRQNYFYNYAIISESYLKSLGKSHCGVINDKIKHLVVAYENISNEDYFFFEYGVRIVCMLPLHGSSMKQVFDCVQVRT